MGRKRGYLIGLLGLLLLTACGSQQGVQTPQLALNKVVTPTQQQPTPMPTVNIPQQVSTPTPLPSNNYPAKSVTSTSGPAPYGLPPAQTEEEIQLTQQLFTLINSDRAARNLYPFVWNDTLANGALLHSWNMYHCGFSHTCPDGRTQCQRIAAEGFAGYTDCGENIAYAGPYPTPWQGVYTIQESMINEPPTGWHRIHLTSTTLHKIGIGVYVDPNGYIWFTEDMVS